MRRGALVVAAALSAGCGGGAPLLHPARTLDAGDMRVAGGVSANVVVGSAADDLQRARDLATKDPTLPGAPGTNPDYAKGAIVAAAIAPGLAPFVGARVGVGDRFEGGLSYTGRAVRADLRRSFDGRSEALAGWSLSLGLGASAALYGRQQGSDLPAVDLGALRGWGVDVPVLGGWQSADGLYQIWFGPRLGYERDTLEMLTSEPKPVTIGTPPIRLEANRWWGGGVVGVATGFRHIHVAIEGSVAYQLVSGTYNQTDVTVRGLTIAPATAVWWTF